MATAVAVAQQVEQVERELPDRRVSSTSSRYKATTCALPNDLQMPASPSGSAYAGDCLCGHRLLVLGWAADLLLFS